MSNEFLAQFGEFLTNVVAFIIFFFLMKRFAWGPVMNVLDERQQRIEEGFADLERKQADAAQLQREYDQRLAHIEHEARTRIQEAIAEGKRVADEIRENAREEADQLLERARRNTELELDKARLELRDEMVAMTMEATERLMREKMRDPDEDRRLVSTFIDDLEQHKS